MESCPPNCKKTASQPVAGDRRVMLLATGGLSQVSFFFKSPSLESEGLFSMIGRVFFLATAQAQTPSCTPEFKDGAGRVWSFDYRIMTQRIGDSLLTGQDGHYNYTMNVCADAFPPPCTGIACQYNDKGDFVANLGHWDASGGNGEVATYSPINPQDLSAGLKLTFTNEQNCPVELGGVRRLEVSFVCTPEGAQQPDQMVIFEEEKCSYYVELFGQVMCHIGFACHTAPCQNGGTCLADSNDETKFSCFCREMYYGNRCELRNPCHESPCRNGGTCVAMGTSLDSQDLYHCYCLDAYEGAQCEEIIPVQCERTPTDVWKGFGIFTLVMGTASVIYLAVNFATSTSTSSDVTRKRDNMNLQGGYESQQTTYQG
eukprot:g58578.t1